MTRWSLFIQTLYSCYTTSWDSTLEEASGIGEVTPEEYGNIIVSVVEAVGVVLVSREQITTAQSLPAELVEFSEFGGALLGTRLIYLHEGKTGFGATYVAPKARHEELALLIEYSLSTFRVREPGQEALAGC